jgi:single-strand DNA-binding protein
MSNTTAVTGNLTREPEIRYTREGHASTLLSLAVNRRWENRETKEWEESTSFFDVVCWRELAENAALTLAKGMRVMVTGRLEQRSWETDEGERRSKVEIVADEVGPSLRFATADVHRAERRVPPERVRLASWVRYRPDEVFEICGALAMAEAVLSRHGHELEAARMAAVFELAEGGLAR